MFARRRGGELVVIVALAVLVVLGTAGHRGFSAILGKYAEGTTDCGGYSPSGIIRIIFGITNKQRKNNYPKEHSADFLPDDYYVSVEINNTLISH